MVFLILVKFEGGEIFNLESFEGFIKVFRGFGN